MNYEEFKEEYGIREDRLKSYSWSLGGTSNNCWGETRTLSPDPQPISFEEFDDLIEKINPNITFLQYKKLYAACVSVESDEERDYYGGTEYRAYFECSIHSLYRELLSRDMI